MVKCLVACPVCNANISKLYNAKIGDFIRSYGKVKVTRSQLGVCHVCGHAFFTELYTNDTIKRLYKDYYSPQYLAKRKLIEPSLTTTNIYNKTDAKCIAYAYMKYCRGDVNILDYGGFDGSYIPNHFGESHVYDLSNTPLDNGSVRVHKPQKNHYDMVICSNILEHTPYPRKTIDKVLQYVKPNGIVVFVVPAFAHFRVMWKRKQYINCLYSMRNWRRGIRKLLHYGTTLIQYEHFHFYTELSLKGLILEQARIINLYIGYNGKVQHNICCIVRKEVL